MPRPSQASEPAQATIVFFPEGAYGPINNCVGIGDVLRRRGHRVVFIVEESFQGALEEKGFEERLMRLAPAPESEELELFIAPTFQALIAGARHVDERRIEIFDELRADVIVEDNVVGHGTTLTANTPRPRRGAQSMEFALRTR